MARPASRPAQIPSGENSLLTEQQWQHVGLKIQEARSKMNTLKNAVAKTAKELPSGDDQKSVLIQVNSHNHLLLHLMFQLLNLSLMFSIGLLVDQYKLTNCELSFNSVYWLM